MRAKLNLFKTSQASRVVDKRHIPGPCGRSECGGRQQRQRWCFCRDANPSVLAPAPPNQGQCYRPHRNKKIKNPPRYSPGQAKHLLLIPKRTVSSGAPRWDDGEDLQKFSTEGGEWRQEWLWARLQSGFGGNKNDKGESRRTRHP